MTCVIYIELIVTELSCLPPTQLSIAINEKQFERVLFVLYFSVVGLMMEAKVVKLHLHAPGNLKNVIIAESVEKQNFILCA